MYCTKCGKELNPNDRFCANCGAEVKPGQGDRKYDNVVCNPPFRMEAEKKTAQILKNREEFKGFKELADENNRRSSRSKAKMDWNLEGFPESLTAKANKSSFDWDSVIERRNSGRSFGFEKLDMSSTMEHKKIDPETEAKAKAEPAAKEVSLGLPPEDGRVISLEELEKELYDLEEELRTDTARTAKYEPLKDNEIDNSEELDAYLDGISKTKKKAPEKKEPKEEKVSSSMRWDFGKPAVEKAKEPSSMGLVWGIDPEELHARRKASKQAKKKAEMVWDVNEKKKEAAPEPETEPGREPVKTPEPVAAPEPVVKPEPVVVPEPVKAPEPIVEEKPSWDLPKEQPVQAEASKSFEQTIIAEPAPKVEQPSFLDQEYDLSKEPTDEGRYVHEVVSDEYKDLIKNAEPEYLDKTRVFDQASLFALINEEKAKIEAADQQEPEPVQEEIAEEIPVPEEPVVEEPVEEVSVEVPAEEPETAAEPEDEQPVEEISEPVVEEIKTEEPVAARPAYSYQSDFKHPWEQETVVPEAEPVEEPAAEEPAVEPEAEPVVEEPTVEEPAEEAPVEEAPVETPAEAVEESQPAGERPQFFTFSQKNEAFQELLQKERARLESMGSGYVPKNTEIKVSEVKPTSTEGLAYEEAGHFVEEVVQPIETTVADLSGDAKFEPTNSRYDFSHDWLSEIKSQTSVESLNKTKLRYSEIFAKPVEEEKKSEESEKYEPKSFEEKKLAAEKINEIFDEDERTKPKKHIIGNTIIILLIIVILFEGSVLAAKLLAPDSGYAHLTDGIIEKVMNLVTGSKDNADPAPSSEGSDGESADAEYNYGAIVAKLADKATTIGEVAYNEDLTYSDLTETAFDGVLDKDVLEDSEWVENDEGGMITYAEAIYDSIIAYYDSWLSGNTDENLVGINRLELGEIRYDDEGYYTLVKVLYADKDGSTSEALQTCYLTENGSSMFIEKISGEVSANE